MEIFINLAVSYNEQFGGFRTLGTTSVQWTMDISMYLLFGGSLYIYIYIYACLHEKSMLITETRSSDGVEYLREVSPSTILRR